MPEICVIVPAYNAEKTIQPCLLSLMQQTFPDFECCIIANGCTDNTTAAAREILRDDPRFRIIPTTKADLSTACNLGLTLARRRYTAFVDADDIVSPDFLKILYETAEKYDADMTVCNLVYFHDGVPNFSTPKKDDYVLEDEDRFNLLLTDQFLGPMRQVKLYRTTVLKHIHYPSGHVHEDEYTAYDTYKASKKVAVTHAVLYGYRLNDISITRTKITSKRLEDLWRALHCRLLEARHDNRITIEAYTIRQLANDVYYWVLRMAPEERRRDQTKKVIRQTIADVRKSAGAIHFYQRAVYVYRLRRCLNPSYTGTRKGDE